MFGGFLRQRTRLIGSAEVSSKVRITFAIQARLQEQSQGLSDRWREVREGKGREAASREVKPQLVRSRDCRLVGKEAGGR